jgi:hypothetical protein
MAVTPVDHVQDQTRKSSMSPPSNINRYSPGFDSSVRVHRALAITSGAFAVFIGLLIVVLLVAYRRRRRHLANQPELAEVCCSHDTPMVQLSKSGCLLALLIHGWCARGGCTLVKGLPSLRCFFSREFTFVAVQKFGSAEMTGNTMVGVHSDASKSIKPPDAYVYCTADTAARAIAVAAVTDPPLTERSQNEHPPSAGSESPPTFSSIALDGASGDLDSSSRLFSAAGGISRFGPSCALVDAQGSQSAMGTLGGVTARERLYILASGTYFSPTRGVADVPLDEMHRSLQGPVQSIDELALSDARPDGRSSGWHRGSPSWQEEGRLA